MSAQFPEITVSTKGRDTILVRNVKKYFGPTRALDGASFSARAGEIHAIVGGNGCGKSTMAKVVSGILPIDSGSVSILGETPATPAESRALGISTVYQEVMVADESTVVDNIFMGSDHLFSKKLSQDRKVRRAAELMAELAGEPIDPFALVGTLPLGIKQWITIARALLSEPKILILDESSAALDFDSTERLFAKMRSLRDAGTTVLIVTHRIAELIRISDRATVLRDGRDVGVLEKADITERNLLALMTGEDQGDSHHAHLAPQPHDNTIALRADGLSIQPGARSFDFELRRGEIVGVAGLDGQGQDGFVRILAGVNTAASGLVQAADRHGDLHTVRSLADAVDGRIAYVSGDRKREGIFAALSIFENMVMPLFREKKRGGILGLIDRETLGVIFKRETENLLIKFGLRGDKITSLSGGNQQKVLIGRGFAMRPDVIVLNDPARGIDVGAKAELYKHLRAYAEDGKSVVYMSSELEEFLGFATRVIVFRDGAPFDAFDGRSLEPKRILEAMFGQTDGSGLRAAHGLTPSRVAARNTDSGATARHSDGVRVNVAVPAEARHVITAQRSPQRAAELELTDIAPQTGLHPKPIKIVEFNANGQALARGGAMNATTKPATPASAVTADTAKGGRSNPFLLMPISLFFVLLGFAVLRSPSLITSAGIGSAIIVATPLILATYALMATVISGRGTVDLSIGPLIGFVNVTLIQLHGAGVLENPFAVFGYAVLAGASYQFVFALIVIYVRVQPIIVSLSGYLALSGMNLVILPRPGGTAPQWMADWGLGTSIFSPVLLILVLASLGWILFSQTAFYTHLRLMGSDERAAYTSGVPIFVVRIGAHLISGCFAGLAAITFTALISSGDPSQGTTYTLIAVTALVLGGASLAGGRGGVFGSFLGAINLYLITFVLATFSFGAVQSFVTNLAYGSILVVSLLLTLIIPFIERHIRNFSPLLYFVALSVVALGVILHATYDYGVAATTLEGTGEVSQLLMPIAPEALYVAPLEVAAPNADEIALRNAAAPIVLALLLLVVIAVFLRVAVSQSDRRVLAPTVTVVVVALLLLGAYMLRHTDLASPPADVVRNR